MDAGGRGHFPLERRKQSKRRRKAFEVPEQEEGPEGKPNEREPGQEEEPDPDPGQPESKAEEVRQAERTELELYIRHHLREHFPPEDALREEEEEVFLFCFTK